ncbi:sporulation protein YabP [Calditerricola yamamurae]
MEGKGRGQLHHEIIMENRKTLRITGVINVESFDSEEFLLETSCGFLAIRGQHLHMKNLNVEQGQVAIEGKVIEMGYLDEGTPGERAKGFFSRLFR